MSGTALRFMKWALIAAVPFFAATAVHAQATRTWVSGVGDDANPCSRTAPCKTYAGAISKTAAGGEISTLDPGGYGGVTITKSITINGDSTLAGILVSATNGVLVAAGPTDVVILRNLSIHGAGAGINGVRFDSGAELHIEKVTISGFNGEGVYFKPSGASRLLMNQTSIRDNVGGAVFVEPGPSGTANATLDRVTMQGNARGLRADGGSSVVISNSVVSANYGNGLVAYGATRTVSMMIESTVVAHNSATGIRSQSFATVRISNVTATGNDVGLMPLSGGTIHSARNNRVIGNITADGSPSATPGEI
jgi:hypothetical protein